MHWMIACDFFIKKAGINRHITEKYVTLSRITQSRDSTMKKNGIYMLLTVAVMLVIALLPSSSQPRSDKAADTVISLEQSRDDGVHNLRGCEGVFTASQSRITECRHNETYSRIVSESGLPPFREPDIEEIVGRRSVYSSDPPLQIRKSPAAFVLTA